jgi:hypothetical protein
MGILVCRMDHIALKSIPVLRKSYCAKRDTNCGASFASEGEAQRRKSQTDWIKLGSLLRSAHSSGLLTDATSGGIGALGV